MPKVSVVIPTYNRAHLLQECIGSVLVQSFQDFEIIIIDDGSTDNTKEVVDSFKNPYIRYLYQRNQGVSIARNTGIHASLGEYIAFLDSDDTMLKMALEKRVEILDRYPEAAFSYGQIYFVDENGRILQLEPRSKASYIREGIEELREVLTFGHHFNTSTVMVRRSCLCEVGGFNPAFICCQDIDLWVRLARLYSVTHIAEPLATFLVQPRPERSLQLLEVNHSLIIESIFNDPKMGPSLCHLRSKAYFNLYSRMASSAYARKEMGNAWDYLKRAYKAHPKQLFSSLGVSWMLLLAKICVPVRIMSLARKLKHHLREDFVFSEEIRSNGVGRKEQQPLMK